MLSNININREGKRKMKLVSIIGVIVLGCFQQQMISDAFPISSSSTPSKKRISNQSKGAGGFGKQSSNSVPIQHSPDTSAEITTLMQFLLSQKSSGFGSPDAGTEIGIGNENQVRGMYATKPFKKGEILCRIPSDCALALSDPALGGDDIPTIAHAGRNFLVFYKLDPKASQLWSPYLNILPSSEDLTFDATPDYFSDDEINALEFPLAIEAARRRQQEIQELADSEEDDITFDDLQFATWIASSRAFSIQISSHDPNEPQGLVSKPNKQIKVLLPIIDMINHNSNSFNAELHLIDPEKDEAWFAIKATRPIKAGKEITISYGTGVLSSVDLLQNYGFVPAENKIDDMMLSKTDNEKIISSPDGWSTTLEEDEYALQNDATLSPHMRKVLQFRCKLKRSYN